MKQESSGIFAEGRIPPPAEKQFPKGRSGNPAGRPRGSISLSRLTRKVAAKKHRVRIDGKIRSLSGLELLITKAKLMAASGQTGAAILINWLRAQTEPSGGEIATGGFVLAPARLTSEEFAVREAARCANKVEPGTEICIESEELAKAASGKPSLLGEALRAFHAKYGASR
jgi:Family of unknown function (DUF5681)